MLKSYRDNQKEKKQKVTFRKSGVECGTRKCNGEMVFLLPEKKHPELKGLTRAKCEECRWNGWV